MHNNDNFNFQKQFTIYKLSQPQSKMPPKVIFHRKLRPKLRILESALFIWANFIPRTLKGHQGFTGPFSSAVKTVANVKLNRSCKPSSTLKRFCEALSVRSKLHMLCCDSSVESCSNYFRGQSYDF
jgi:hypothetical protein